ncbi:hypothetical protein MXD81_59585 [Microbacteriaceae bacterium K1510]|nr:hypothetical protein [Microbacteriaceae bacterium K1510]
MMADLDVVDIATVDNGASALNQLFVTSNSALTQRDAINTSMKLERCSRFYWRGTSFGYERSLGRENILSFNIKRGCALQRRLNGTAIVTSSSSLAKARRTG